MAICWEQAAFDIEIQEGAIPMDTSSQRAGDLPQSATALAAFAAPSQKWVPGIPAPTVRYNLVPRHPTAASKFNEYQGKRKRAALLHCFVANHRLFLVAGSPQGWAAVASGATTPPPNVTSAGGAANMAASGSER